MTKPRIAITIGDPSGIGPEVVSHAVRDPRVLAACEPLVVGDPVAFALHKEPLPAVEMLSVPGHIKKVRLGTPSADAGRSAVESLRLAIGLVHARQVTAIVTAPVSKESFQMTHMGFPGHTEWLAHECKAKSVAMLMVAGPDIGSALRTILVTRHVPLAEVSKHFTATAIMEAARLGFDFVKNVLGRATPRLVVCGLNPHAGDHGLIGHEEMNVVVPTLKRLKKEKISIDGPVASDAAFRDMKNGLYDLALAAYHDQGMIPLKVYAPDRLVNITLGLPFIRTSPGHGTAYDIAGKHRADPRPMIEAILLAAQYSR